MEKGTGRPLAVLLMAEGKLGRSPPLFSFLSVWPFPQKQEPKLTYGFKPSGAQVHQSAVCLDRALKGRNKLASPKKKKKKPGIPIVYPVGCVHEHFRNVALSKLMGGTVQPSLSFWSLRVFMMYCIASWRTFAATWAGRGFSITWEKIVLGLSDGPTRLGLFCSVLVQCVFLVWLPAKNCTTHSCSALVLMTTLFQIFLKDRSVSFRKAGSRGLCVWECI